MQSSARGGREKPCPLRISGAGSDQCTRKNSGTKWIQQSAQETYESESLHSRSENRWPRGKRGPRGIRVEGFY